jgi:hypothetical protein
LGANFNARLNGATISSASWSTNNPTATVLDGGDISGGLVTVGCTAGIGAARVRCQATLSDGSVVSQLFKVGVQSSPWYSGESVSVTP